MRKIYILLPGMLILAFMILLLYQFHRYDTKNINSDTGILENQRQNQGSESMVVQKENIKINITMHNKIFTATLENNEITQQLINTFPLLLDMNDLHANEKYHYLDFNLPINPSNPSKIHAGDIKLYGNNCLVIFYKDFSNSYAYTNLGKIDDIDSFVTQLHTGISTMKFEIAM